MLDYMRKAEGGERAQGGATETWRDGTYGVYGAGASERLRT